MENFGDNRVPDFVGRTVRISESIKRDESVPLPARELGGCVCSVDGVTSDGASLLLPFADFSVPTQYLSLCDDETESFVCFEKLGFIPRSWVVENANEASAKWVAMQILVENLSRGNFPSVETYSVDGDTMELVSSTAIRGLEGLCAGCAC